MSDLHSSMDDLVEEWLDLWDDLRDRRRDVTVDEFVGRHCAATPPHVIEQIRRQLRGLDAVDRVIGQILDDTAADGDPARPP